jgi:beta-fructofuranosidase
MYTGHGFRNFEIGDVDVIVHDGVYHLFHLTLPNQVYIAHAVSEDGLSWHRVKNALFISDPLFWDDDMLWTMHISPDPYHPGWWRMFYTGLCMRERGRVQRVGMARSNDLYTWEKDTSDAYPLEIAGDGYETSLDEGRHWVSFRDPFFFSNDDQHYLLAAGRVDRGPIIRRGCVALAEEVAENRFEFREPLYHPMRYDDVEVPNLVVLEDRYYLIGSIREDIKVHYWYADTFKGPYRNFYDNVLLPQGNYAARVSTEEDRCLVWNFFFRGLTTKGEHLMAPPKELVVKENGELGLKSFAGFDDLVIAEKGAAALGPLAPLFDNPHGRGKVEAASCWFACDSGFEAFLLNEEVSNFILTGELTLEGNGKAGMVLRVDEKGDGYYLSLDVFKGLAQIRAWGHRDGGDIESAYFYEQLQAAHYVPHDGPLPFRLLAYQQYLEFSLDGFVLLTLADDRFEQGRVGFYVESARGRVDNLQLKICRPSAKASYPEGVANF